MNLNDLFWSKFFKDRLQGGIYLKDRSHDQAVQAVGTGARVREPEQRRVLVGDRMCSQAYAYKAECMYLKFKRTSEKVIKDLKHGMVTLN